MSSPQSSINQAGNQSAPVTPAQPAVAPVPVPLNASKAQPVSATPAAAQVQSAVMPTSLPPAPVQAPAQTPPAAPVSLSPEQLPIREGSKRMFLIILVVGLLLLLVGAGVILLNQQTADSPNNLSFTPTATDTEVDSGDTDSTDSPTPSPTVTTKASETVEIDLSNTYADSEFFGGFVLGFDYPAATTETVDSAPKQQGVDEIVTYTVTDTANPVSAITYWRGDEAEQYIFEGDIIQGSRLTVSSEAGGEYPQGNKEYFKMLIADSGNSAVGVYFNFGDRHLVISRRDGSKENDFLDYAKEIIKSVSISPY